MDVLNWNSSSVTKSIKKKIYQGDQEKYLYTPSYIRDELDSAYGFNFYGDCDVMLLRFNRDYHERYIKNTIRHSTFERIENLTDVTSFIEQQFLLQSGANFHVTIKQVLTIVDLYPNDAYYKLCYRVMDNNVIMRLRSWGFNVEIMLPLSLRLKIKNDIEQTYKIYTT